MRGILRLGGSRRRPTRAAALAGCAALAALALGGLACSARPRGGSGAEDLWGNEIDLDRLEGLVLIEPFSPANCGYCLVDGAFIHANYLAPNEARGGHSFYQCLFNPQRDVLAYLKHFRTAATPVLAFPPALHARHGDGFPFLVALRDGALLYQGPSFPYEAKVRELSGLFWPERASEVVLTSPSHLASGFVHENQGGAAVFVVPDGDEEGMRRWRQRRAEMRGDPGEPKFEGELTADDLRMNLLFNGPLQGFKLASLQGADVPVRIDGRRVALGPHAFARSDVGLRAAFPNPHNPERYVLLALSGPQGTGLPSNNWADYAIYAGGAPRLEGLFAKLPGNRWVFADSLCFAREGGGGAAAPAAGAPAEAAPCSESFCPAPVPWSGAAPAKGAARAEPAAAGASRSHGQLWTLGGPGARFPSLAAGPDGACWVAWEERGDIFATRVGGAESPVFAVQSGGADSYDPLVAVAGEAVWVFYLAEREGFWRLQGRCLRAGAWSVELAISEPGPLDVVTPAVAAGPDGRLALAWSQWKANQRFLQFRTIVGQDLGPVATAAILPSDDGYQNAWYASLAFSPAGELWGAWNQHYPALLGVCSGDLLAAAVPVTRLAAEPSACENGGYPAAVVDAGGGRWVFWESFGWDVLSGKAQAILASRLDAGTGAWSASEPIATGDRFFCQTPAAALGADGVLRVVWSGRDAEGREPWAVYEARREGGAWSDPARISPAGTSARAPRVSAGGPAIWYAWHAGVGDEMRVTVARAAAAP